MNNVNLSIFIERNYSNITLISVTGASLDMVSFGHNTWDGQD